MNAIRGRNEAEKGLRPFGDRPVECHFALCLQQKCLRGVGSAKNLSSSKQNQVDRVIR